MRNKKGSKGEKIFMKNDLTFEESVTRWARAERRKS